MRRIALYLHSFKLCVVYSIERKLLDKRFLKDDKSVEEYWSCLEVGISLYPIFTL